MKKRPFTNSEWNKINHRRHCLIGKKFGVGLTTQEESELEKLEAKAGQYLDSFDGPPVALLKRQIRGLRQEARSALASTPRRGRRINPFRDRILALMDKEGAKGLTKQEKVELARLQREGIRWTAGEAERHPPTAREVQRMDQKAKEFTRKLLAKR